MTRASGTLNTKLRYVVGYHLSLPYTCSTFGCFSLLASSNVSINAVCFLKFRRYSRSFMMYILIFRIRKGIDSYYFARNNVTKLRKTHTHTHTPPYIKENAIRN